MAETSTTKPAPELPRPRRFLTADEAIEFLGLRGRTALNYLHMQPDGPPFVRLTARSRVYDLVDLQAWAEARKTAKLVRVSRRKTEEK